MSEKDGSLTSVRLMGDIQSQDANHGCTDHDADGYSVHIALCIHALSYLSWSSPTSICTFSRSRKLISSGMAFCTPSEQPFAPSHEEL